MLAVVFGRVAELLDEICEAEMQRKMFVEIGSWRCTFKKRASDMQRGEMSRKVTILRKTGPGWDFDGVYIYITGTPTLFTDANLPNVVY